LTIHYGGEMWRPLVDVRDAARAYITCLEADEDKIRGEVFNVVYENFRISELALRVVEALKEVKVSAEIRPDYRYHGVRSYRVSGKKIERTLDFAPAVSVEEAVKDMVESISRYRYTDFDNPRYYNILWMKLLEEADRIIKVTGSVFDLPASLTFQPTLINPMRKKQGADH